MSLFISSVFTYDEDAGNYIQAVEGASGDNQALEPATRKAINNFVIGCKQDGIWTAIKASCILSGARTLAGALQPLVGTAPTNNGPFVNGDYVRKTGLVGNAGSKFLSTNRAENADPRNSFHLSVFVSTPGSGTYIIGAGVADFSCFSHIGQGGGFFARNREGAGNTGSIAGTLGFLGTSRALSSGYRNRGNATDSSVTSTSAAPGATSIAVFRDGQLAGGVSSRLAFYSIGESLDLARLDGRVTELINAFAVTIP
jgi:hypothetical protein